MANLVAGGFTGPISPSTPTPTTIEGLPATPRCGMCPWRRSSRSSRARRPGPGVARECAAAGVRALVVVSAGFSEAGEAGEERQRELLAVCRGAGMRLVGPNCLGVINTDPGWR